MCQKNQMNIAISAGQKYTATKNKIAISRSKSGLMISGQSLLLQTYQGVAGELNWLELGADNNKAGSSIPAWGTMSCALLKKEKRKTKTKTYRPHLYTIISVSCTSSINTKHPEVVGNFLAIFHVERKFLIQPCTNIYNAEQYYSL